MIRITLLLALILLLGTQVLAPSTVLAQETLVPLDKSGNTTVLTPAIAKRIALFDDYPGFQKAMLYHSEDSGYFLEIMFKPETDLLRKNLPLSMEAVEELRGQVETVLQTSVALRGANAGLDQEGRARFLRNSLYVSLGVYSWTVPLMLGIEDAGQFAGMSLLTSSTSFFLPLFLTRNIEFTEAEAALSCFGAKSGLAHGFGLGLLAAGEGDDHDMRFHFSVATVTSIIETVVLYHYAKNRRISIGEAEVSGMMSDTGLMYGVGLAYTMGLFDDVENDEAVRVGAIAGLGGAIGGFYLGHHMKYRDSYSIGDVGVMRTTRFLGGVIPVAAMLENDVDEGKPVVAAAMIGMGAGIFIGDLMVRGYDFTEKQNLMMDLGTGAGALLGGAVSAFGDREGTMLMSAGAVIGLGITYATLKNDAYEDDLASDDGLPDIEFSISPENYMLSSSPDLSPDVRAQLPIVRAGIRF